MSLQANRYHACSGDNRKFGSLRRMTRHHAQYLNPQYENFTPRTLWSPSNAFTTVFTELEPIPLFKVTAKLAGFLEGA